MISWTNRVPLSARRLAGLGAAAIVTAVVAACSENLNGGAACPKLCPGQTVTIYDTTYRLDSLRLVFDTTVASYPALGTESALLLSNVPGVQDVRAVVRFDNVSDSIGVAYLTGTTTDSTPSRPITSIDTAVLFFLVAPSSVKPSGLTDSVLISVYDVDAYGVDTVVSELAALFTRPNLVGQTRVSLRALADTSDSTDTVRVAISRAAVLAHVRGDHNVRFGIRIQHAGTVTDPVRLWVNAAGSSSGGPHFFYRAHYDTFPGPVDSIEVSPASSTPTSDPSLASQLANYPVFVLGAPPVLPGVLDVGGLPARRVYLRFNLPSTIVDSSNVLRATLRLKQIPRPQIFPTDSVAVWPAPVVSSSAVTEPAKAALFIVASSIWSLDSTLTQPQDTGVVAIELSGAFKAWHQVPDTTTTRAIVLRVLNEGANPVFASFYSSLAADTAKRPHLEIRYVRQTSFLLP